MYCFLGQDVPAFDIFLESKRHLLVGGFSAKLFKETRGTETPNRLKIAVGGEAGGGDWLKEDED